MLTIAQEKAIRYYISEKLSKEKKSIDLEIAELQKSLSTPIDELKTENHSENKKAMTRLAPTERENRVRKVCLCLNNYAPKSVPCSQIASHLGIDSKTLYAWMKRYLERPECPWKQGNPKMSFTLK